MEGCFKYSLVMIENDYTPKDLGKKMLVLMDGRDGQIMPVEKMKVVVSELTKTIKLLDNEFAKEQLDKECLEKELRMIGWDKYKSNYPINCLRLGKIKIVPSNMRKTNRRYKCICCGKKYNLNLGDYRYKMNAYSDNYFAEGRIKFVDFSDIEQKVGSCCSKECLLNISKYVAVNSINPSYSEFFNLEFLESDLLNEINQL